MTGYRRVRRWLSALLFGYVGLGFAATAVPGFEVFPFFCWFLFPITPSVETRYALEVEMFGGAAIEPPRTFQELDVVEDPFAMDAWTTIQALGRAVDAGDSSEEERLRARLEANYLARPSRYRLVRRVFDPLDRWSTGRIEDSDVLARYASERGCEVSPWAR